LTHNSYVGSLPTCLHAVLLYNVLYILWHQLYRATIIAFTLIYRKPSSHDYVFIVFLSDHDLIWAWALALRVNSFTCPRTTNLCPVTVHIDERCAMHMIQQAGAAPIAYGPCVSAMRLATRMFRSRIGKAHHLPTVGSF
jgi:hypothetical protein